MCLALSVQKDWLRMALCTNPVGYHFYSLLSQAVFKCLRPTLGEQAFPMLVTSGPPSFKSTGSAGHPLVHAL